MMKFIALGLAGVLGLFAAAPAHACGNGSCGASAAPVVTAAAKATRSYSYAPSAGTYGPRMMMGGGMMGGGASRSAGAKALGR